MKIFAEVTEKILALMPERADKTVLYSPQLCATEGDKSAILFRGDTAYELGGSGRACVAGVVFSDDPSMKNEVVLYGPDLDEISEDSCFAHITLVRLKNKDDRELTSEQLKGISFTAVQIYPQGYHIRISPSASREQVRVAKTQLQGEKPLSFMNVGCSLIRAFREKENVEAVRTVFITKKDFDYKELSLLAQRVKKITDAVQSTLQLDELDCASCKMKPICDEVEGLRELHLKKEKEKH